METRAKDLKDFTMWNSTNSSIKFLDLSDTILTQGLFFDCDLAIASPQIQGIRLSKFDDKFAVPLLYDQKRMDLATKVEKSVTGHNPFIAISLKKLISGLLKRCGTRSFECFLKPVKQTNIGVRNFQDASIMAIFVAIIRFVFEFAGMKTSFAVDYPSKISQIKRIVDFGFVKNSMFIVFVGELHKTPMFQVHQPVYT